MWMKQSPGKLHGDERYRRDSGLKGVILSTEKVMEWRETQSCLKKGGRGRIAGLIG